MIVAGINLSFVVHCRSLASFAPIETAVTVLNGESNQKLVLVRAAIQYMVAVKLSTPLSLPLEEPAG